VAKKNYNEIIVCFAAVVAYIAKCGGEEKKKKVESQKKSPPQRLQPPCTSHAQSGQKPHVLVPRQLPEQGLGFRPRCCRSLCVEIAEFEREEKKERKREKS
jgi:hypothetical protein